MLPETEKDGDKVPFEIRKKDDKKAKKDAPVKKDKKKQPEKPSKPASEDQFIQDVI